MSACASTPLSTTPLTVLHAGFLALLPRIELHARITFRHFKCPDKKEDAVAEVVAIAWLWFVRLAQKGKDAGRFPMTLAAFAARAVKSGGRLCGMEKSKDVLSPVAQQRHSFVVTMLPEHDPVFTNPFSEALADNMQTPVPEQVCFRVDFPAWLQALGDRNRRIALDMALGHRTVDLAAMHGLTQGRISQLRQEFHLDWLRFHGAP
jgi:hypothetical protein